MHEDYIDVATLAALHDRQRRAGLVESVKHGMVADAEHFAFLEANMDRLLARDEALGGLARSRVPVFYPVDSFGSVRCEQVEALVKRGATEVMGTEDRDNSVKFCDQMTEVDPLE